MTPPVDTRPRRGDDRTRPTRTTRPPRLPVDEPAAAPEPRGVKARRGGVATPPVVPERPAVRSRDGRVVLDPRLRARRVEVRRDAGRRRLHRLALLGGAVALVVVAVAIVQSPLLAVRHLEATPTAHLDAAALRKASGLSSSTAMIDVDQGAVERRLEAVPWVDTARVTRSWPSTVRLVVTERRPVAQLHVGSSWFAVDASGRVLEHLTARAEGLVVLEGLPATDPGSQVRGAGPLLTLATRLPAQLNGRVAALRSGRGDAALDLALVGGGSIRFGSTAELDEKLVASVTMLDHVEASCLGTIDVQVPAAPTLTPTSACA